jgi:NAD(P)H-quinone oxidoreductase subunit 6
VNFESPSLVDIAFYGVAAFTVACALYAVFSRNIVRAVFSLLGTFVGIAIFYALLSADFVAVVQILVYVGGVAVLMLFAVMLTSRIDLAQKSSRAGSMWLGMVFGVLLLVFLVMLAIKAPWQEISASPYLESTAAMGDALLEKFLLPFEIMSLLLVSVIIGAVVIARRKRIEEIES